MADLIGFEGFLNETAPFQPEEYDVTWKTDRNYSDFTFNNVRKDSCEYPRFWNLTGERVLKGTAETAGTGFDNLVGCYDSEFDQVRLRNAGHCKCYQLTVHSTAIPKPLVSGPIGNVSSPSLLLCKIACENGYVS